MPSASTSPRVTSRERLYLALRVVGLISVVALATLPYAPARALPRQAHSAHSSLATHVNTDVRVLPLHLHVAQVDGQPVVDASFIETRLARANAIYAPYRVRFAIRAQDELPARYAVQETRSDRDALAEHTTRLAIDCFLVASLRDVDEPERMRRGVHWHAQSRPGRHYVILSSIAGLNVFAHELGHFLGNPEHSQVVGNLMSYEHTDALPVLDAAQLERLERALAGYLRRGELRLLPR